jgi:crotonobetainyl-CoA:carnitine CoA-transferase CaiB-like acyl-CoA transferase
LCAKAASRAVHKERLLKILSATLAQRTKKQCDELLASVGVPCAPVNELGQALTDPHVQARGLTRTTQSSKYGSYSTVTGPLPTHTRPDPVAAPALGEHTIDLLQTLGYDADEIADLVASETVATSSDSGE